MTMASTKDSSASAGNIVRLYGSAYVECGYCKGGRAIGPSSNPKASSKAYSILAEQLDPALYEQFLYKGWRRSGNALYKPDNWKSCCPALTIRLEANQYTPTKSQRKVLRQMKRLLEPPVHQHQPAKASTNTNTNSSISASTKGATGKHSRCRQERIVQDSGILESLQEWTQQALAEIPILQTNAAAAAAAALPPPVYKVRKQHKTDDHTVILFTTVCAAIAGRSHGAISRNDLAVQLANVLSKRHACVNSTTLMLAQQTDDQHNSKKQRPNAAAVTNHVTIASVVPHMESGQVLVHCVLDDFFSASMLAEPSGDSMVCETAGPAAAQPHSLGAWWASETSATSTPLPPLPDHSPYELTVETVSAHESALDPAVHALYFRYQTVVHNDPDPFTDVNLASASAVAATASSATWATKAPATWLERAQTMLRKEYQHLEGARQRRLFKAFQSFYEFLVENPFATTGVAENDKPAPEKKLFPGTYHQHYRLAGLLVAVGVVDVLPGGLSSVYLFYDPSFSHQLVAMGKYAILREIEWTKQAGLPYYYLGYYIESCPKMRYKADYHPSELLCPTTYVWVDAEQAKETIQRESPERHCCALYSNGDSAHGSTTVATGVATTTVTAATDKILMEVGAASPVTIGMLLPPGQALVRPHLEEFIKEAGAEIGLQCTVNFG